MVIGPGMFLHSCIASATSFQFSMSFSGFVAFFLLELGEFCSGVSSRQVGSSEGDMPSGVFSSSSLETEVGVLITCIRGKSEWNDSILLIDRDHCLYTRPREDKGTCPFGMAPS